MPAFNATITLLLVAAFMLFCWILPKPAGDFVILVFACAAGVSAVWVWLYLMFKEVNIWVENKSSEDERS